MIDTFGDKFGFSGFLAIDVRDNNIFDFKMVSYASLPE